MAGLILIFMIFILTLVILVIAGLWKVYEKAGQEGWKCLIPIYNAVVLLRIVGKPAWWIWLMVVPFIISAILTFNSRGSIAPPLLAFALNIVGYVYIVWTYNMLSKSFGKTEAFTAGLLFLGVIFIPILGFGDSKYLGPYGDKVAFDAYNPNNRFDFEDDKFSN